MDHKIYNQATVMAVTGALPGDDLPGAVMTNEQLSMLMEQVKTNLSECAMPRSIEISDPDFPFDRVGIRSRRILDEYFTTRDLAVTAAQKLLKGRDDADKIRAIVLTTVTPDRVVPNMSTGLQYALELPNCVQALDLHVGCSGSTAAMETAARLLASYPEDSRVLVVGADAMMRVLDASDRGTCIIFGDGAGAILLGNLPKEHSLLKEDPWQVASAETFVMGSKGDLIEIRTDNIKTEPVWRFVARDGQPDIALDLLNRNCVHMDGRSVYKDMIKLVPQQIEQHLASQGLVLDDVDTWIFHQANGRMIEAIAHRMGIPLRKIRGNIEKIGNTTNGAIPILLADEMRFRPNEGKRLMMVGFGTGYSIGIIMLERSSVRCAAQKA